MKQQVPNFLSYPEAAVGTNCVYLLQSLKDHEAFYIGRTSSQKTHLQQHNSHPNTRHRLMPTSTKQPWALLAYVSGFRNHKDMTVFQQHWLTAIQIDSNSNFNTLDIAHKSMDIIKTYPAQNLKLIITTTESSRMVTPDNLEKDK
jgi:predicted GIY-YIG superfamily endonuclease